MTRFPLDAAGAERRCAPAAPSGVGARPVNLTVKQRLR